MACNLRPVLWLVLALLGVVPAARGEGVVVSSTVPGMTVGQVVADDDILHLPADSLAVVLLASGQVVKLAGPYDGKAAPTASAKDDGPKTVLLENWQQPDLSSLGGARGQLLPRIPPLDATTAVVVDAGHSATWCIAPKTPLSLAAPGQAPARLDLEDGASGARASIAWPPATGPQPWPPQLAPRDGSSIMARWDGSQAVQMLHFQVLDADQGNTSARLIRWWRAGCRTQLEPQLRALGAQMAPFALYLSTDRGRTPRYAIGEPVDLVVQANRASFLYCFILQDGQVRSVFPGASGRMRLPDQTEIHIAADRLPLDITAPPPRLAELRCYAVAGQAAETAQLALPAGSGGDQSGSQLDRLFASLANVQVAQAHLTVRTD